MVAYHAPLSPNVAHPAAPLDAPYHSAARTRCSSPDPLSSDERDLRWYFGTGPEEALLQSGFPALLKHLLHTRREEAQRPHSQPWELALDRHARRARLESLLDAAGSEAAEVLAAGLGPELQPYPRTFGRYGRLALGSRAATSAYLRSKSRVELATWLSELIIRASWSPTAKAVVTRLHDEAQSRFHEALLAYREAKRRTGLTGRAEVARRTGPGRTS